MSKQHVLDFFQACAADEALLQHFNQKSLPELLLHARSRGFEFTQEDLTSVIGTMEVKIIMERRGEEINAYSTLWPQMWGKPRFQYVIEDLYSTFAKDELLQLAA
ncbi:MAG: Nif11-like leader peptide family natural product precursor [Caldilineaceae bacterium]